MKSSFNPARCIALRAHAVLLTLIVAAALLVEGTAHAAVDTYMFRDSLAPAEGLGNTLVATYNNGAFVNGSFVDTTIDASVCPATPTVRGWSFPQYGGLQTPNNAPLVVGGSYTISMIVKFNPMRPGYSRLIDFSNSTLDTGIYELDGGLSLYPVGTFAPGSFVNNTYSFVTFTRDAATNVVSVFVGTTPAGTYTDTTSLYVPSAQNVIFMMDNTTGAAAISESSPGVITYLKLIDTPVTAAQIPALQAEACSTVVAPTVTGINPSSGPTTGGTSVTITGSRFTGATAVKFGANDATAFTVNSDTQITATSPAGVAGVVDVTVTTASGPSATGANDKFTYVAGVTAPTATTTAATGVTASGATLNGTVTANGASTTVTFGYGLTAAYGSSVAAAQSPLAGSASGASVSAAISGLACNTLFHFHVTANNGTGGTIDGGDAIFTTLACPIIAPPPVQPVPTPSEAGALLLVGLLILSAALWMRRRKSQG